MPQITVATPTHIPSFEIQFRLTKEDKLRAEAASGQKPGHQNAAARLSLLRLLVGVAMLVSAGALFWFGSDWSILLCNGAITALTVLLIAMEIKHWGQRHTADPAMRYRDDRVVQRWRVVAKGLERSKSGTATTIPWKSIRRVQRLDQAHGIFLDDHEHYVIPDRGFLGVKQRTRFLRLVSTGITKARKNDAKPGPNRGGKRKRSINDTVMTTRVMR